MPLAMSRLSRLELLSAARRHYRAFRSRKSKHDYLVYLQELTGYSSLKTIIRHLSSASRKKQPRKRGCRPVLNAEDILALKELWFAMDQPCGKRFCSMLPEWLPFWESVHPSLSSASKARLLRASSATLDRALRPFRTASSRTGSTGALTALKSQIPLVDSRRRIQQEGYLYADTVAHCGESTRGSFVWTLTLTDDLTQWTSNRAVWNKGQYETRQALDYLFRRLPFMVRGINTDNGSEFINHHLQRYLKEKRKRCEVTRSRPMHKNDNARAEEKNRHKVRELIGYDRLENEVCVRLLNTIYRASNELNNHFSACIRLMSKQRTGVKVMKCYDKARTPYQRVMEVMKEGKRKESLKRYHASLNPFVLKKRIENGLKKLYDYINNEKAKAEMEDENEEKTLE